MQKNLIKSAIFPFLLPLQFIRKRNVTEGTFAISLTLTRLCNLEFGGIINNQGNPQDYLHFRLCTFPFHTSVFVNVVAAALVVAVFLTGTVKFTFV